MKPVFFVFLGLCFSFSLYAQHTIGDVRQYEGWYSIKVEIHQTGTSISITQRYPSGEELEVIGDDRYKLPLYVKIFSLVLMEELFDELFGDIIFEGLTFEEDGFFMRLNGFSFSFDIGFTISEEEILDDFTEEELYRFRNMRWP